jgi:hypothetical protein
MEHSTYWDQQFQHSSHYVQGQYLYKSFEIIAEKRKFLRFLNKIDLFFKKPNEYVGEIT